MAGGFPKAGAVAIRADFGVFGIRFGAAFFLVNLGFRFGVERFAVVFARDDVAVSPAGFAPAAGGVEREVAGVEFVEGLAGGGGDSGCREGGELAFGREGAEGAFAVLQGPGNDFGRVFLASDGAGDEVDVVGFVASEGLEIFGFNEFAIDEDFIHARAGGGFGVFLVEAFAAAEDGGEEAEGFVFGEELAELLSDRFGRLGNDGFAGLRAMLHADFGVEEAEEVEDLGDGADGGFTAAAGDALFDGNGGWEAFDEIEVGLFQLARKLAGVGRHRVEKAPLAFCEEDVEGEGGLTAAGESGDDDKFVEGDVERDVFEVVVAEAGEGDLRFFGGFFASYFFGQGVGRGEGFAGFGFAFGELFGGAGEGDLSPFGAGVGADLDDVVGVFNDVELVFDDEEGVAGVGEAMEDAEEDFDVSEVKSGGRLVEDEEGVDAAFGVGEELAEFEALGFASGEGVEWLAEAEVAESSVDEGAEGVLGFGDVELFLARGDFEGVEEFESFGGGELENLSDGAAVKCDVLGGLGEAGAFALGAGEVEVGEKLHFDLFEAVAGTALAASGAGVEGKVSGGEFAGFGGGGEGEELADVLEGAEEDGGSGTRGAGERGLVDELHAGEFVESGDLGGRGFFVGDEAEVAGEIVVDDGVGQGGFSGSGNSGECDEDAEGDVDVEVFDVVDRGAGDGELGLGLAVGFGDGDGFGAVEIGERLALLALGGGDFEGGGL